MIEKKLFSEFALINVWKISLFIWWHWWQLA